MLNTYANIYSDNKERFAEVTKALEKEGFIISYSSNTVATVIKEVPEEADSE